MKQRHRERERDRETERQRVRDGGVERQRMRYRRKRGIREIEAGGRKREWGKGMETEHERKAFISRICISSESLYSLYLYTLCLNMLIKMRKILI